MTPTTAKILMACRGMSRVNIFRSSVVISISPPPPWCHTNASLLFHWAHWHGRFPLPQWCIRPKLNAPSLLPTTAEKQGGGRTWMSNIQPWDLIKRLFIWLIIYRQSNIETDAIICTFLHTFTDLQVGLQDKGRFWLLFHQRRTY